MPLNLKCCAGYEDDADMPTFLNLEGNAGAPVFIHVYDLDGITSKLNLLTVPLFNAGAFHVGVEIYGKEYSFGMSEAMESGITVSRNLRVHPFHIYSKTVYRGFTKMSENDFQKYLEKMARKKINEPYNIITNNCVTFADELCVGVGVQGLPSWIINFRPSAVREEEEQVVAVEKRVDPTRSQTAREPKCSASRKAAVTRTPQSLSARVTGAKRSSSRLRRSVTLAESEDGPKQDAVSPRRQARKTKSAAPGSSTVVTTTRCPEKQKRQDDEQELTWQTRIPHLHSVAAKHFEEFFQMRITKKTKLAWSLSKDEWGVST